ncbi:dTDP-Rha--alpha-D-GlcNAc-pyrophosphate polyprenol alpha-3-L-rhamnosyltransferase [Hymenobacter crusticola]|uniref:dTDP-Rha--alpha-D-GlcNAc-pyrophosphate polyprenol alpha-3-L-rhamnosyltransferase n=2 Tax=Hymenobacter crusticola TaxID=1770526 RepID=A0A243WBL4_9BACT|nr:dTDP-Rha--alpha-D-GlcNAc-pyrophosphate polyprenol alpha-3-L-rhamnosyltransferase [Hymenobacter crusticola]
MNWNGQELLRQFLPSVLAYADGARVIVADNASTDDSVGVLRREFPGVELIQHAENLGFCEGYNHALRQVDAAYYVLLNSDVAVTPGWLQPLRALFAERPHLAACQPKIRSYAEPAKFEYAGAGGGYLDKLGYPFCRGRLFDTLEPDTGQYDDAQPVAWATGACMVVRAAAWHALGGLEKAFFAHMEEIDLCWRFWNAGYEVWYQGGSTVYHVGGGTLPKSNPRKTYLNFRNGLALVYKNLPKSELARVLITRVALDWVAAVRFLAQGATADARAILRAHRDFLHHRLYWKQRRQQAHPMLGVTERPGTYPGSLVWAYFVQGKHTFPALGIPSALAKQSQQPGANR